MPTRQPHPNPRATQVRHGARRQGGEAKRAGGGGRPVGVDGDGKVVVAAGLDELEAVGEQQVLDYCAYPLHPVQHLRSRFGVNGISGDFNGISGSPLKPKVLHTPL